MAGSLSFMGLGVRAGNIPHLVRCIPASSLFTEHITITLSVQVARPVTQTPIGPLDLAVVGEWTLIFQSDPRGLKKHPLYILKSPLPELPSSGVAMRERVPRKSRPNTNFRSLSRWHPARRGT